MKERTINFMCKEWRTLLVVAILILVLIRIGDADQHATEAKSYARDAYRRADQAAASAEDASNYAEEAKNTASDIEGRLPNSW